MSIKQQPTGENRTSYGEVCRNRGREGEFGKGEWGEQKERNATFGAGCVCSRSRESCHLHSCNGDIPFRNKGRAAGR